MKTRILMIGVIVSIIAYASCTKDQTIDQTSFNLADDDAVSSAIYDDVFNTADNAEIILNDGISKSEQLVLSDSCPVVTITNPEEGFWPKTITVDFGEGCTDGFGNVKSGKIIIVVTGPRFEEGSKKTVTFENYYFNGIAVEGTHECENMGYNTNQNLMFSVKLMYGKLTLPDGDTITREFQHQREWVAGIATRYIWDDEFLITGTTSGVNINGVAYTNTIATPLRWQRACRFIISGVVNIEREGEEPVEINYGNGECDADATVTHGGETKQIKIRARHRSMGS